jgi:hypothetical protein
MMITMSTASQPSDDRAKLRALLNDAETDRLLIEIVQQDDPQPYYSGRSARRAWEDCDMFDDKGVEIILRDPQDRHECGRIAYHLQMFSGRRLSHPSGDWMIAWCGRHHLKF